MTTLFEPAYAKVNLTLDVLGKREDGYHDLQTVMQRVSLCDDIELDIGTGKEWVLKCDKEGVPCDERNLAWKAAKLYCDTMNKDPQGLEIRITKRIPSQAGMGGGSSDAAAVLLALNRHYGNPLSLEALADLGGQVGSDVPFCVAGGTCMCEGRGELLRKLPDMPRCWLVVVKPEFSVSTPVLYRKLDEVEIARHPDNRLMEEALISGDLETVAHNLYNVFEPVVAGIYPELESIKSDFRKGGAMGCQMTGSGSATFAIVSDEDAARKLCCEMKKNWPEVFVCQPV